LAFPQAVRRFSCLPPRQAGPLPCAKTTNSSEAQAPAILDHARGLPQGEGRTRPEDWRPSNGIATRCHRPFARLGGPANLATVAGTKHRPRHLECLRARHAR